MLLECCRPEFTHRPAQRLTKAVVPVNAAQEGKAGFLGLDNPSALCILYAGTSGRHCRSAAGRAAGAGGRRGDLVWRSQAEEITQAALIILAKKAGHLRHQLYFDWHIAVVPARN